MTERSEGQRQKGVEQHVLILFGEEKNQIGHDNPL